MAGPSYLYTFPLSIGGGAFLTTVSVGILLGAAFYERRNLLLALFGGLGVAAACATGGFLPRPHGAVTRWQVGSLVFAIAVEMVGIAVLRRWLGPYGERTLMLGVLVLVGAHFLLMYPAFGPLIALLGLAAMGNAGIGLAAPGRRLRVVWLIDGCLKLAAGLLLWLGATSLRSFGF